LPVETSEDLSLRTSGEWSREKNFWLEGCAPLFFVSVASKRVSPAVSLLFATLAGRSISVAGKGLKAALEGLKVGTLKR
jgi:hypothetical protein